MKPDEFVDLSKMAVRALLVSIVLSVVMSFFFVIFGTSSKSIESMQRASQSAVMDRMYELRDQSDAAADGSGNYPLVANVTSALSEFREDSMLFILVSRNGSTVSNCYTFNNVVSSEIAFTGITNTIVTDNSGVPNSQACKELLKYSDRRCSLSIVEAQYGGNTLNGIHVFVY